MATVRMKKGIVYADVFDSPETIRNAQLQGYSLCDEKKVEPIEVAEKGDGKPELVEETTEKQSEEQIEEPKVVHKRTGSKK